MNNSSKHFRFLDLPAELRNTIYEKYFEGTQVITVTIRQRHPPPLLTTCKQIYNEAGAVYYRSTLFYFEHYWVRQNWLVALPSRFRKVITKLRYNSSSPVDIVRTRSACEWAPKQLKEFFRSDVEQVGARLRSGVLKVTFSIDEIDR